MRHLILLTLVCLLALSSNSQNIFDDNSKTKKAYEIKGEIRGLNDSIVILGYYQADKQYAKDTAIVKKKNLFSQVKIVLKKECTLCFFLTIVFLTL